MRATSDHTIPIELGLGKKDAAQVRRSRDMEDASYGIVASSSHLQVKGEAVFIPWEWLLLL